ncbi:MAG: S41 family peptidase [Bacilli bacterium]|nr:S41 family peptidase [Bacilli bacterium]MDD4808699.1 S41 family peptidase [Bacilli bacterium]
MEKENIKSVEKKQPKGEKINKTSPLKKPKPKDEKAEVKTKKTTSVAKKTVSSKVKEEKVLKPTNPPFNILEVVCLLILTFLVTLGMSYLMFNEPGKKDAVKVDDSVQNFLKEYNYIIENYYGEVDQEELLREALESVINALDDPYSTFMDDASNSTSISLEGSFQGIGVEIVNDTSGNIIIVRVLENSPAEKAGIKVLDIIKKMNDITLEDTTTSDFVKMVSDQKDASFNLTLLREEKEITVKVNRQLITIQSVKSDIFEKNNQKIGYLSVDVFAANTFNQFKRELNKLEEQKIDSLIIDLRDNSGGHLSVVANMISQFLDTSHVIYQTETKEETKKFYSTGLITKKYPIVILSSGTSASASEVMMGALKDEYPNTTIIGETSFGKGTVQEVLTLPSDEKYKLTTKKWLTPKGTWVNKVGIKPDIEIKLSDDYYKNPSKETDNQLQEAIKYLIK